MQSKRKTFQVDACAESIPAQKVQRKKERRLQKLGCFAKDVSEDTEPQVSASVGCERGGAPLNRIRWAATKLYAQNIKWRKNKGARRRVSKQALAKAIETRATYEGIIER